MGNKQEKGNENGSISQIKDETKNDNVASSNTNENIQSNSEYNPKKAENQPNIEKDQSSNGSRSNEGSTNGDSLKRSESGSDSGGNSVEEEFVGRHRRNLSDPGQAAKNLKENINIEQDLKEEQENENKAKTPYYDEDLNKAQALNIQGINSGIINVFKSSAPHFQLDKTIAPKSIPKSEYELAFYRNSEEIRKSYMEKLICKRVWVPEGKPKTHNSLIIFDWDDTLLCTSHFCPNGIFDEDIQLSEKDKEKIKNLEENVKRLLEIAIEKAKDNVYIITNAGNGWVEYSCEKFYPSVVPILRNIKIISARGEYEEKYPGESKKWKIFTFLNLQKTMNKELVTNIICLGDSFIEMDAGRILASKFTQAFIKTVKFRESPKPEELNKQLLLVIAQFNSIVAAVKNLTVRVEKKRK